MIYKAADLNYDAANRSPRTLSENEQLIGKRATLTLTGTVIEAGASTAGSWIRFKCDSRWDFKQNEFVMDADPLEVYE